jgi:hypothetical protein
MKSVQPRRAKGHPCPFLRFVHSSLEKEKSQPRVPREEMQL